MPLRAPAPDPQAQRATQLNRLYEELRMARRAGDKLTVELTQKSIDDILDHWRDP